MAEQLEQNQHDRTTGQLRGVRPEEVTINLSEQDIMDLLDWFEAVEERLSWLFIQEKVE